MSRKIPPAAAGRKGKGGASGKASARAGAAPARSGKDFGQEGTNKTIAVPKPDGAPSEELGNTQHIEKTPYTRG